MARQDNQRLQQAILQVVQQQIEQQDPPETKQTLGRLQAEGFSRGEALNLIGYVVAAEVMGVMEEGRRFDRDRFVAALKALPKLPWEKE